MGFLIKVTFWFSLVLLALPLGTSIDGQREVGAVEAIIAAGAAVNDIAGMCQRKPEICETGKTAISTIGFRARAASRIAYDAMGESPPESASVQTTTDATVTGSVPAEAPVPQARDSVE